MTLTAFDADPARAILDADVVYRWHDGDHLAEIRARSTQTSDAAAFQLSVDLDVGPRRRAVLPADLDRDRRAAARLSGPPP